MSFIRQRSPARWAQAETLASVIDARLQADPTNAHADALARISSAARAFVTDSRASTAALDGSPETAHPAVLSALRAGHHFETALDAYPLRWVDRLIYEPLLWLALVAGLVLAAATIAHAAMWMGGSVDTWAQRDRRRLHARLFWGAFLTEVFVALIAFLLLATHSLNNGIAVVAVSVLAAAGLAARMIAERRGQESSTC
jgi:hypothetical protein